MVESIIMFWNWRQMWDKAHCFAKQIKKKKCNIAARNFCKILRLETHSLWKYFSDEVEGWHTHGDNSQVPWTVHMRDFEGQVVWACPFNSNQFEFIGQVAGTKSLQLNWWRWLVHTKGLLSTTCLMSMSLVTEYAILPLQSSSFSELFTHTAGMDWTLTLVLPLCVSPKC